MSRFHLAASRRFAFTVDHSARMAGVIALVRTGRTPALQFHD